MYSNAKQIFDYEVHIIKKENILFYPESNLTKEILKHPKQYNDNSKVVLRAIKKEPTSISNESLQNLILFYIDYKDIKKNSQNSLKDNFYNNKFGYYDIIIY